MMIPLPPVPVVHAHSALWAAVQNGMHSQFFGGGAVLMVMGGVMAYFRQLPNRIYYWLRRRCTVDLTINGMDPIFTWFLIWLNEQPYSKKTRTLSVQTAHDGKTVIFTPSTGNHFFRYKHRWVRLSRSSQPRGTKNGGDHVEGAAAPSRMNPMFETMSIEVLGHSQETLRSLVEDARVAYLNALETTEDVKLHRADGSWWQSICTLKNRPLDSVILPTNTAERLVADISAFLNGGEWYRRRGIPYRRGYLFYGLPGTGKSSLVQAVACALQLPLFALNIGSKRLSDESLQDLFAALPERCIILMEDVDAAVRSDASVVAEREPQDADEPALIRTASAEGGNKKDTPEYITLSGLLNVLDGVGAAEGRVLIMTTNRHHALDSALIRPGRIDLQLEFTAATYEQARTLFARFYDLAPDSPTLDELPRAIDGYFTMAEMQGIFLEHRDSAEDALRSLRSRFELDVLDSPSVYVAQTELESEQPAQV
jgi:chaperone BCS1